MRKLVRSIQEIQRSAVASTLAAPAPESLPVHTIAKADGTIQVPRGPQQKALVKELEAEGDEVQKQLAERQRELIESLDLSQ